MIKNNYKKTIALFFIMSGLIFLLSQLDVKFKKDSIFSSPACAVQELLKVYLDGKETNLTCEEKKDIYLVPLSFPFKEGENKWEVTINYNSKERRVDITKKYHPLEELLPTRGDEDKLPCSWCKGTGDCQVCCPVGSGHSSYEDSPPCTWCGGNGKCWYCGGRGGW